MKATIGQTISSNETKIASFTQLGESCIPYLDRAREEFEALEAGEFDDQILTAIINTGAEAVIESIKNQFRQPATGPIAKALQEQHLLTIDVSFDSFRTAVSAMNRYFLELNRKSEFKFYGRDFKVVDGAIVFDETKLRKQFTYSIQDEKQLAFYSQLEKMQNVYNETHAMMQSQNITVPISPFGLMIFFQRKNEAGEIEVNGAALSAANFQPEQIDKKLRDQQKKLNNVDSVRVIGRIDMQEEEFDEGEPQLIIEA